MFSTSSGTKFEYNFQAFRELKIDPLIKGFAAEDPEGTLGALEAVAAAAGLGGGSSGKDMDITQFLGNMPVTVTDSDFGIDRLEFTLSIMGDLLDAIIQPNCWVTFKAGLSHYEDTQKTVFRGKVYKKRLYYLDNGMVHLRCICHTPMYDLTLYNPAFPITYPALKPKSGFKYPYIRKFHIGEKKLTITQIIKGILDEHKISYNDEDIKAAMDWQFKLDNDATKKTRKDCTITQRKNESDYDFIQRLATGNSFGSNTLVYYGDNKPTKFHGFHAASKVFMEYDEEKAKYFFKMVPTKTLVNSKAKNVVFRRHAPGYSLAAGEAFNLAVNPDDAEVQPVAIPMSEIEIAYNPAERGEIVLLGKDISGDKTPKLKPIEAAVSTGTEEEEPPLWLEEWELDEGLVEKKYKDNPEAKRMLLEGVVSGSLNFEDVRHLFRKKVVEVLPADSAISAPNMDELPEAPEDMEDEGPPSTNPLDNADREKKGKKPETIPEDAQIPPLGRMGYTLTFKCPASTYIVPRMAYEIENLSAVVSKTKEHDGKEIKLAGFDGPWYLRKVEFVFSHIGTMKLEMVK